MANKNIKSKLRIMDLNFSKKQKEKETTDTDLGSE